jgi:flagellar motor switch/type III secretory pathway protein FliN
VIVRDLCWVSDEREPRLRRPQFERRVPFPIEAAVGLARVIEMRASEMFAGAPAVDVFPPVLLDERVWQRLCDDAYVFEIGRATLVIPLRTASRVARVAFGEAEQSREETLSTLELRVVERFARELADCLRSFAGDGETVVARTLQPQPRAAYCELRFGAPLDAGIGIAISEAPQEPGPRLAPAALDCCPIECAVRFGIAGADIFTIAALRPGDILRLDSKVGSFATLNVGPDPIAKGEGGVLDGRSAFRVHELL